MKTEFDVVFALTGDVRRNSRALKQLRLLSDLRLNVLVLCYGPAAAEVPLAVPNAKLRVLPRPAGSGPRFFWKVHLQMRRAAMRHSARVYHASDLYVLPAMSRAAVTHGSHLVFDSRELYTHVASTTGRPWVRMTWHLVQKRHVRKASAVFTVSDPITQHLGRSYSAADPIVLHNVPPRQIINPGPSLRTLVSAPEDAVILLHQGSIQKARGCEVLVEAMQHVRGGVLIFLGGGPLKPDLKALVRRMKLTHCVHFLDPVAPDELLAVTATADVGITLLEDTCLNHRFALPNKLFEYLIAGVPVMASDLPQVAGIVRKFDVGRVVNPAQKQDLVRSLQYVIDHADQRRRWAARTSHVLETYNWESASERFSAAYRKLVE